MHYSEECRCKNKADLFNLFFIKMLKLSIVFCVFFQPIMFSKLSSENIIFYLKTFWLFPRNLQFDPYKNIKHWSPELKMEKEENHMTGSHYFLRNDSVGHILYIFHYILHILDFFIKIPWINLRFCESIKKSLA